jgi:hypothetical protein
MAKEAYQTVNISSIASSKQVTFSPVIFTQYSDDVNVNFNSTVVFARTNPIYTYSDNNRSVNCSFICPLESVTGLTQIDNLARMVYPSIDNTIYKNAPLVMAKFGNFHSSPHKGFIKTVKYDYVSPDKIGNFPLVLTPVAIPRFIKVDLSMTIIATQPITSNGSVKVFG